MAQVARTPAAVAYKSHVLSEMSLVGGMTVVDVGCGPGTDLADAAALVSPRGLVIGLDRDERMLAAAARREPRPQAGRIALVAADAHSIPLQSNCIDRIRTDRALQHMRNPRSVLQEFRRVLLPGCIAVVAEPDWRTLVIDGGCREVGSRFVDFTCEQVVRNATIGRELARLGQEAGLVVADVAAFSTVLRDFVQADKIFGFTRNAHAAAEAGHLTRREGDAWVAELRRGPMLVAVTLFVTTLIADPD